MEVAAAHRPGYRFAPTDEELIDILEKKAANKPIPVAGIHEVDISRETPMALSETFPRLGAKEWYFFTMPDRKYPKGTRPDRRCGDNGFLKASQGDTRIYSVAGQIVIGFRKKLVFCEGRRPDESNTDWKIDEYRLNRPPRTQMIADDMKLDWMLIRIYQSRYRKRNRQEPDPPAPANSTAPTDNTTNHEAIEVNVHDYSEASSSSTSEYNALQQYDMGEPAAAYKIPKLIHFDSDIDFSGINVPVPVNTAIYNPTNYGENAFYYDAQPPQLSYSNFPCIDFGIPSPTDDTRNRQAIEINVGGPGVPVVNTGTTDYNTFEMSQQMNLSFPAIDYSTPSPTDDARNQQAMGDPGVPVVNSSTTEYNTFDQISQPIHDFGDFDFPDINFIDLRNIDFSDFSIPSPTDDAIRNRQAIEIADDPGVPVITTTDNALQGDFDSADRNFINLWGIDFSDFSIPSPTDDAIRNRQAIEIADDPGVPVTTTTDNALRGDFDSADRNFINLWDIGFSDSIPYPTDDAIRNRQATEIVDDPGVPVTTTFDQMPQQINFEDFDFQEINFRIAFQDIDFSPGDFGINSGPDHMEH